jgi:hypothetical protein
VITKGRQATDKSTVIDRRYRKPRRKKVVARRYWFENEDEEEDDPASPRLSIPGGHRPPLRKT